MSLDIKDLRNELTKHKTKKYSKRKLTVLYLVVHHSATPTFPGTKDFIAYSNYHVNDLNWPGIAYHYGVNDDDGVAYLLNEEELCTYHIGTTTRNWKKEWPNHPLNKQGFKRPINDNAIGVVLPGNFDVNEVPKVQWDGAVKLFRYLLGEYPNALIIGHREVPGAFKTCPGEKFDLTKFISEVRKNPNVVDIAESEQISLYRTLYSKWAPLIPQEKRSEFVSTLNKIRPYLKEE